MSKIIYDIIPPQYRPKVNAFWQANSGRVKLGALGLFLISLVVFSAALYTNLLYKQAQDIQAVSSLTAHPTSNGNYTAWTTGGTCASGAYDCVNDESGNAGSGGPSAADDTNYITSSTVSARSSFNLNNSLIPSNATISQLDITARAQDAAGAPQLRGQSAVAASTGADVTVTLGTHETNDILLLEVVVRDTNDTITWPSGWAQLATVDRGTTARYWWAWKRAASSSEPNPLVDKSTTTGDTYAMVTKYYNAITTGDPWEVKGTAGTSTADPVSIPSITTLTPYSMVVAAVAGENNNNAAITTTGTTPASYSTIYDESATGADGVTTFSYALRSTAGATGTVSVDWGTANPVGSGYLLLALKPSPSSTELTPFYRLNSTDTDAVTTCSLTSSWADCTKSFTGLNLTSTDLDNLEIGVKHDATSGPTNVSQLYVAVTYDLVFPQLNQTGYIWENDDEDQVTGDAVDENTQQFAGNTAKTSAKVGERVTLRAQIKNTGTGAFASSTNLGLFYDRNDGYFTKVQDKAVITSAGNCTDTKWDCATVNGGDNTSIVVGPSGTIWVAYYDLSPALAIAHYVGSGGSGCTSSAWSCEFVDKTTNNAGASPSIALDSLGNPWISYQEPVTTTKLKVAHYVGSGGTGCTSATNPTLWTCETVDDPSDQVGSFSSIAVGPSGDPWVAYRNDTALSIKVAHRVSSGGTGCTSATNPTLWTCETVDDTTNNLGAGGLSIDLDPEGDAWISYDEGGAVGERLKVAYSVSSGGTGCTGATNSTLWICEMVDDPTDQVGYYASIAFDSSGNAWVSYQNQSSSSLKVVHRVSSGGTGCTGATNPTLWTCETVDDTSGQVGYSGSIAFGPSGSAMVTYRDNAISNQKLIVAYYVGSGGSGCTSGTNPGTWSCTIVDDPTNRVGEASAIAFDTSGNAWVSYNDISASTFKVASVKRGGEIGISSGLSGASGDPLNESHADMTTTGDTANRDDADCLGGGTWNNGKWFESEEATGVSLPAGSGTAQCTEISFNIDLSQAQSNTTYRFVVASKDAWRKDKGLWRGPVAVSSGAYATLTTAASTTTVYSKDNQAKFADCTDTAWGCQIVDTIGTSTYDGRFTSIAFDPSGNPWVSYLSGTDTALKVANYVGSGGNCTSAAWNCTIVDTMGTDIFDGWYASIAFDPSGNPWVSYYSKTDSGVKVANYVGSGGNCTSAAWNCAIVDAGGASPDDGDYASIAFDFLGNPWVSYHSETDTGLKVANYVGSGGNCTSAAWNCTVVDNTMGSIINDGFTSIAIDPSGNAWVSYQSATDTAVKVANYVGSGGNCTSAAWNCTIVDTMGTAVSDGRYSSIAFDFLGNAWVSYYANTGTATTATSVRVANYVGGSGGTGCGAGGSTAWNCTVVDTMGTNTNDGRFTSIAFGPSGNSWVSYHSGTDTALKIAKFHLPPQQTNSRYVLDTVGYTADGTDDTSYDTMAALANERPYQLFRLTNGNNTDRPTAQWIGQSTIAAASQNIKLEIWRGGTTNAWETVKTNSTCLANVDCTIDDSSYSFVDTDYSDYYDGSFNNWWRVWQVEGAGATSLKADLFQKPGASTNSVSGSVCTNEACSTFVTDDTKVVLKKNGADACSGACTATTTGGAYSISGITGEAANDILTIYIGDTPVTDDNGTYNGVAVTKISAAGNLTDINLITSRIVLRHEGSITSLANTDLQGWDKDNDADIKFTSNAGAFVSDNTEEVHVWTGKTWAPAGTVTTNATSTQSGVGGDLHIDTSATLDMAANALSVGGDYNNAGTLSKSGSQTTTFAATGSGFTITPGTGNFENVIFDGSSGGWGFASAPTLDGNLTITNGVLTPGQNMTVGGSWTNSVGTTGFVAGSYIVTFNTSATALINGTTTFNNFNSTVAGKIFNFKASQVFTFADTLTITGTSGNLIQLHSDLAGTQWKAHFNANQTGVSYATIKDSGCDTGTSNETPSNSTDEAPGGTNGSCWIFAGAPTLTQRSYIFEDDDGANVNVNNSQVANNTVRTSVKKGERLNVRVQIDNTGTGPASAATYDLQACNFTDTGCDIPAEWATVSGATDIRPSWGLSGGSGDDLTVSGADRAINTTASGTDCVQAGPTFDATANTSEWYENTGTSNSVTLTNNKCYEMSFDVHTGAATLNKEYRFRIVKTTGATVLDAYSQYPTLTIASSEDRRYSKDTPTSLGSTSSDLVYYLDNRGYSYVSTDDNVNRDPNAAGGGTNIPVLNAAYKYANADEFPSVRWNGQSNVAPSTRTLTLQAFRFGASNAWETVTTNNTTGVDTDFELSTAGWAPAGPKSDYYSSSWAYFRVYQTAGIETIKTDWVNWGTYRASAYVISQTFDTNATNGAGYQSIMWKGSEPTGTNVRLQLATSNSSSGPWTYIGGSTCATTDWYAPAPNVSTKIGCHSVNNNKRYFRYKVFLDANATRDVIPQVDDVIVTWSP